jgi:hypothetical protein
MNLPHHIAGVSLGLALAACSGAQNGANPMTLPNGSSGNGGADGGTTHYTVPAQRQAGARKHATSALILVANENTGLGGSIREYAESANGNVAPRRSSVTTMVDPTRSRSTRAKASALQTATSIRVASPVPKPSP